MDGAADTALQLWGLAVPIVLLVVGAIVWLVVHLTAAPDTKVSLLWGFATYQKKPATYIASEPAKLIEVIHGASNTMWRVKKLPKYWIDGDLSRYGSDYCDSIIIGPYHAEPKCKADLSYFDASSSAGVWGKNRIQKRCPGCNAEIMPKNAPNSRDKWKQVILRIMQEAYLRGEKIRTGMRL